jgi:hypothetical protein
MSGKILKQDLEPFEDKMARLSTELLEQFRESELKAGGLQTRPYEVMA